MWRGGPSHPRVRPLLGAPGLAGVCRPDWALSLSGFHFLLECWGVFWSLDDINDSLSFHRGQCSPSRWPLASRYPTDTSPAKKIEFFRILVSLLLLLLSTSLRAPAHPSEGLAGSTLELPVGDAGEF